MLKWPVILVLGLIIFLAIPKGPEVIVDRQKYSIIGSDKKELQFIIPRNEEHILQLRSASTLPLKEQLSLIDKLLTRINKDRPLESFKRLSLGRLVEAFGTDRTISDRLVAAARSFPPIQFNKLNNAVRDIANNKMIYAELKEVFAGHGLTIKVSMVEKVLVNKDRLPYDGQFWFSINP